jgi:hypothetical protein
MDDFRDAARAFIHLVERVERIARTAPDTWDTPALGVWTVRDLIGHTARAISTVETYLDLPAPSIATVPSAEIYYLRVFGGFTDHGAVAERGIAAGRQLGDDAGSSIAASLERALSLIDKQPASSQLATSRVRSTSTCAPGSSNLWCTGSTSPRPPDKNWSSPRGRSRVLLPSRPVLPPSAARAGRCCSH